MSKENRILGVLITNRQKEAGKVQSVLTKYGCSIKTRLGLHEATDELYSTNGLILLELTGNVSEMEKLEQDGDPRLVGNENIFESYPRYSPMRKFPGFTSKGKYNPKYQ